MSIALAWKEFEDEYHKRVEASKSEAIKRLYTAAYVWGHVYCRIVEKENGFWEQDSVVEHNPKIVCSPFLFPPFRKEVTD